MKGIIVHSLSFHMKFIKLTKGNNVDNSEIFFIEQNRCVFEIFKRHEDTQHSKARFFLMVDLREFFFQIKGRGAKKK